MKNSITFLFIFICLLHKNSYSQTFSDSNKKTLVTILPKDQKWLTYSIGGTSAETLIVIKRYNQSDYVLESDQAAYGIDSTDKSLITSKDASLFFVTASLTDVNKSYNDFFSNFNQPKAELGISYAVNSVTWVNWDKLRLFNNKFFKQWDFYVKAFANNTFSNYYDVENKTITKTSKWALFNYGLQTDFIGYNKRFWIAVTATGYNGMPVDNLKSYQDVIPISLDANSTIVPVGKAVGKYGTALDRSQINIRTSLALPIFLADKDKGDTTYRNIVSKLCFIPNYSQYGGLEKDWYHVFGGSLGVLKASYDSGKNDCIKIKPMLQFGVDWQSNPLDGVWSKPNWIFSFKGTF